MFDNIPEELRLLRQWILHDASKRPYQINGEYADVTQASTWNSFDVVRNCLSVGNRFTGLGLVLTESDPYSILDLDHTQNQEWIARQLKIFQALDSYSEISLSGKGLHIIVKGKVPSGARKDKIEIYSSCRYMAMTGNVYNNKPIEDRQELLIQLWNEIRSVKQEVDHSSDEPETKSDQEIIERCRQAENSDKFTFLFDMVPPDPWPPNANGYPSRSEADGALVLFISFYTRNKNQIERIFKSSGLGNRRKTLRNLQRTINSALRKAPLQGLAPIDIAPLQEAIKQKLAGSPSGKASHFDCDTTGSNPVPVATFEIPPGLIGRLAEYIYQSAARPVWEIALGNAIAVMAGICGKAYTCKGSTLNLYVLIVADTGVGKEAGKDAISTLFRTIDGPLITPIASKFRGPGQISSGQALTNYIKDSPSFVCMLGEFGIRIQTICDPRASSAEKNLYASLLDLFGVGKGVIAESIYADKQKSTKAVDGHAISLIGDTTPETFYSMIDESLIASGLLPRFIIMEYNGKRQYFNEDKIEVPSSELVRDMSGLIVTALGRNSKNIALDVPLDDAAKKAMRDIDTNTTDMMNDTSKGMNKALWNRAHLKIQRLAALCAIGINPHMPTIDYACVLWAAKIVYHDIELLLKKFADGNVGRNSEEAKQYDELKRGVREFVSNDWSKVKSHCPDGEQFHKDKIIPQQYLNSKIAKLSIFKHDKLGPTKALERAIKNAINEGLLIVLTDKHKQKYNTTRNLFGVTPAILD